MSVPLPLTMPACKTDAAGLFSARAHAHGPSSGRQAEPEPEPESESPATNAGDRALVAARPKECLKCLGQVGITGVQTSVNIKELPTFDGNCR